MVVFRIALLGFALSFAGCLMPRKAPSPTVGGGCSSGVEYQGQTLDLEGAFKVVGAKAATGKKAIREVSDVATIYLNESASLCDQYRAGDLSAEEYADRRERLSTKFAALAGFTEKRPPAELEGSDIDAFLEVLPSFAPSAQRESLSTIIKVWSHEGEEPRLIQSGDVLKSGTDFTLEIDVDKEAYLYVVIEDSTGKVYRIYPSEALGKENPVSGEVRIPPEPDSYLTLDNKPGTETLYVIVGEQSALLETALGEVGFEPKSDLSPVQTLASVVRTRGVYVRRGDKKKDATFSLSSLGHLAGKFEIEHR